MAGPVNQTVNRTNSPSAEAPGAFVGYLIVRFLWKICCNMQYSVVFCDKTFGGETMTNAIRVSGDLVKEAKIYSKVDQRSITGQIEHWARIGKCAEENPDLTYSLIKEILVGVAELDQGESSEYKFG